MKNNCLLKIFLLLQIVICNLYPQAPEYNFVKNYGSTGKDLCNAITADKEGNVFITGEFANTINFGSGISITSAGNADFYIAKLDPMGNPIWAKRGGSPGVSPDRGYTITLDGKGNVYAAGSYFNTAVFDTFTITNLGNLDGFIVKYDTSGRILWLKEAKSLSQDQFTNIQVDHSNNIIAVGYFGPASDNKLFLNSDTLISNGQRDIFIVKYDSSGNVLWSKNAGGANSDEGESVAIDNYDNIIVTGSFKDSAYFDGTKIQSVGGTDIFIAKYNSGGILQWVKSAGGVSDDKGRSVSVDVSGSVYLTGNFTTSATFESTNLAGNGGLEIFVAKYNSSGDLVWVKQASSSSSDIGYSIAVDDLGNSYVSGKFSEDINFENLSFTNFGNDDIFIAQYDNLGNILWVKQAGGIDRDQANSIFLDEYGKIYLAGYIRSSSCLFDQESISPIGGEDIFIAKLKGDPLPVDFYSFSAHTVESGVLLEWITATEINNKGFEIQRSIANGEFEKIGFIYGNGTTSELKKYHYIDDNISAENYAYRLKQIDFCGTYAYSDIVNISVTAPESITLQQNFPNPFNPITTIKFSVAGKTPSKVSLKVYDVLGKEITSLVNQDLAPGQYSVKFDADAFNLTTGVYFYAFQSEDLSGKTIRLINRMLLVK